MALVGGNLIVYLTTDTRQFEAGMSKAKGFLDGFKGAAQIASGILMRDLARGLTQGTVDALKMGAQIRTLTASFKSLSQAAEGYVPSLNKLRTATQGMVSDTDLLLRANEALALGIPTEHLDELFDSAIRLGKAMGLDATQGIQALTIGVGRQSRLVLDNLGIIVRAEESYKAYASRIGKTSETLTDNERRLAFQTIALEKISEKAAILGDNISDTDKSMMQWTATIKNTTTAFGQLLQPLGALTPALQTLGPSLAIMGAQILPTLSAATLGWAAVAALAVVGVVGLISVMRDYRRRTDEVIQAQSRLNASMGDVVSATADVEAAQQALGGLLTGQTSMWDTLSSAIDRRADATARLTEAEDELLQAETSLVTAQQDLIAFTSFLKGDTEEYTAVVADMVFATAAAELGIQTLSTELQGLQGIVSATSAELQGLQGEMTGLTDEQQDANLELMQLDDALDDGRISHMDYGIQVTALRERLKELRLEQAELRVQIRDTSREEEAQAEVLSETQGQLDELIDKNNAVVTAEEDVEDITEKVNEAFEDEVEAIQDVNSALGDLETAHDGVVTAQDALIQSNAELETSLRGIEQATKDLKVAEDLRAADKALRQQEAFGDAGDIFESSVVTPSGGAPGTTEININIGNFIGLDEASTRKQIANVIADIDLNELRRRGVTP